jgi:hypothetical protein
MAEDLNKFFYYRFESVLYIYYTYFDINYSENILIKK